MHPDIDSKLVTNYDFVLPPGGKCDKNLFTE